jgi:hypothetical protein
MTLVCEGLSNKDIGRQFNLSDGTVKVHLHHIYEKLAIHNRTALAILAAGDLEASRRNVELNGWHSSSQEAPRCSSFQVMERSTILGPKVR